MSAYGINVTVHVFAAVFWLGGLFHLALVGAPVLRRVEPDSLRAELFRRLGERSRTAGWIALGILVLTGIENLRVRGLLTGAVLGDPGFWREPYGRVLAWKLGAVVFMLVVQALHDFVVGPRASGLDASSPEAALIRRRAAWLARLSAVAGVVILIAAVRLARGL
ncbi:MAG: DUF4149 domain-containing protein [Gemmatimonadota bacterium]